MRILKVVQAYSPFEEKGGPVFKVRALARRLAQRGHHVTVLTADLGFGKKPEWAAPEGRCAFGWREEEDSVEAIYLPTWLRYRTLTVNPAVIDFCAESLAAFDVVHIYGLYDLLGPAVALFCRRRTPYIVEPMGMYLAMVRNIRLKKLYHQLLGRRLVEGSRRVIATSEQEKEEFIGGGIPREKIYVRRNGIELPDSLPEKDSFRRIWNISRDAKLILFLGRLISKKSPDLLLEAYAHWRVGSAAGRDSALVLAGPEEGDGYLGRLKDQARRLGIGASVIFTGPLYGDAKWAAYRDADVFVLPSVNENFGNTAGESIGCGTPVIVSDRCGIAPLLADRAALVVPLRSDSIEEALRRILEDDSLRDHLRTGCRDVARELTWDEPLAQMESLYREIASQAAGQ